MRKILIVNNKEIASFFYSRISTIMLLLFPFFKTSGFDYIPGLSILCNGMIMIECLFFLTLNILEKRMSVFGKLIILLQVWIFFIAPKISGYDAPSFFYFAGALGILSFFEVGMPRNSKKLMRAVSYLFTLMTFINTLQLLAMPNGFISTDGLSVYIFGLRTGFSLFIIPGIMFNLINDMYCGKRISFSTVVIFITGTFALFREMIGTGICELMIIVGLLLLIRNQKISKKINFALVALLLMLLNISMTILGHDNKIMYFISDVFNKDISLSGRTEIWQEVVKKIATSPIAGVGRSSTVTIGTTQRPAHNQWLHFGLESGYVGMIIIFIAVLGSFWFLYKKRNAKWYKIVSICTISILVGSITEIQTYVPFFYVVYDMPYLLTILDEKKEDKNEGKNKYNSTCV